ncbi:MAG: phosphoglycolate phosphatase [Rhizobiales bacterium]|nr:phosphoglycolate phosphatase [Hyphomicrobiales bacterium]
MSERLSQKDWPKAVIMDLDGTLIDSAPDIARALNCAFEDEGLPAFTLDEVRFMIGGGVPKLVERAFDARNMPHDDKEQVIIDGVLKHYTEAPVDNTVIYDGVEHVLSTLRARGIKVGLCTNKPQGITEVALDQLNMTAYFDAIVGGTADTKRKPDPETLQLCADKLGIDTDDCLLVGDSGADRGAAEALEMTVFLVEYGYCKTPVATLSPDGVLEKMSDLLKILFPLDEIVRG